MTAAATVVLLAADLEVAHGVTVGLVLALALAPTWVLSLSIHRTGWTLMVCTGVAVLVGAMLTLWAPDGGREVSPSAWLSNTAATVTIAGGVGVVLWARQLMPTWQIGVCAGLGLLAGISSSGELYAGNPWRFGFSVPVTVLVLSLLARRRRRWAEMLGLTVLAAVAALTDARSGFAILVLTLMFCMLSLRHQWRSRGRSPWVIGILAVACVSAGVYLAGQALILDGRLGAQTQARTEAQLETSGSLIMGGRPEMAATESLFEHRPLGFGAGTLPTGEDVAVAKAGMRQIGYDPDNGYVERYLFGTGFKLHSMLAEWWAWFSFAGVGLAFAVAWVSARLLGSAVQSTLYPALLIYLALKTAWSLMFSPVSSSVVLTLLFIGLALPVRDHASRVQVV